VHIFFYTLFLSVYHFAIRIAARWNPKARAWVNGRTGIFDRLGAALGENKSPLIWLHCSSLGEFEQGRPVLESLRRQYSHYKVLLTFFSPSGYEAKKDYNGADFIFYLPADSRKNARRFITLVQPQLVLWVKYDYWYYYLAELKQKNIPLLLISGAFRASQPFFKWYGRLHRYMLESFRHLFVQTEASAQLLRKIGFGNSVSVAGDTRFDRVLEIANNFQPINAIEKFCETHPVIVAGSTWAEDEEEIDHYANTHPHIRFIVAPHDVTEDRLKEAEELFRKSIRYSAYTASSNTDANVLLIDNIGMLSRLYKYATITYVGGGFGKDGVHNVLEAAVYGKPVIFGPEYEKYIEAVELVERGGAYSIESAVEVEKLMNDLLSDVKWLQESGDAARNYVRMKEGATQRIISYIQENRLLTS
jgi:3-deoxy-D-manno-octulosonic-acid transferase